MRYTFSRAVAAGAGVVIGAAWGAVVVYAGARLVDELAERVTARLYRDFRVRVDVVDEPGEG